MAVNSKDIETLWKQYSEEGFKNGISVVQFFESNGVPYNAFEKWYRKKFSNDGIVDCVLAGSPAGMIRVPEGAKQEPVRLEFDGPKPIYVLEWKYLTALLSCPVIKKIGSTEVKYGEDAA